MKVWYCWNGLCVGVWQVSSIIEGIAGDSGLSRDSSSWVSFSLEGVNVGESSIFKLCVPGELGGEINRIPSQRFVSRSFWLILRLLLVALEASSEVTVSVELFM